MSTQYLLLTNMLKLLKDADFNGTWLSRVECLIYRLKLVLLTRERHSSTDLDRHCPIEAIQRLNQLLVEASKAARSGPELPQIEAELERLIQRTEAGITQVVAEGGGQEVIRPRPLAVVAGGAGPTAAGAGRPPQ